MAVDQDFLQVLRFSPVINIPAMPLTRVTTFPTQSSQLTARALLGKTLKTAAPSRSSDPFGAAIRVSENIILFTNIHFRFRVFGLRFIYIFIDRQFWHKKSYILLHSFYFPTKSEDLM